MIYKKIKMDKQAGLIPPGQSALMWWPILVYRVTLLTTEVPVRMGRKLRKFRYEKCQKQDSSDSYMVHLYPLVRMKGVCVCVLV